MQTAENSNKTATFKVAFITGASIFVMGYLNALALNTHNLGTMISAQSGNVVWMGINAASGYWGAFIENIGLFLGFAGGAAFALITQNLFKNKAMQFFYNWTIFITPIVLYPILLQYIVPPLISFLLLGFASGAALGFFRKMYHLEINNAMATGSARFVGLHAAGVAKEKNKKKELFTLFLFLICVLLFAAGSFLYGILTIIDYGSTWEVARLGIGDIAYDRLSFGIETRSYGYVALYATVGRHLSDSNLARIIGLIAICVIPYFFCPKNPNTAQSSRPA